MTQGFSTKQHGQMKVIDGQLTPEVLKNRQAFLNEFGLKGEQTVSAVLEHGNHVELVTSKNAGTIFPNTDAFVTQDPKVVLTITAADCLPINFYDEKKSAIGIAHAGWKGVLREVAVSTLYAMHAHFGSEPETIKISIGPHLKACHFEVQDDVLKKFTEYLNKQGFSSDFITPTSIPTPHSSLAIQTSSPPTNAFPLSTFNFQLPLNSSHLIDLAGIVSAQLQKAGVQTNNIQTSTECTFELANKYFSYRRDKPETVEAQLAFISLS